jgi:secernin
MCDTLCLRTTTGMVFAKNSDRPPGEAQVLLSHEARRARDALDTQYLRIADPGAHALVASHPTWLWGAEHGINEHGVAIGNELVWTIDDPRAQLAGLLGMDLVRLGLERGRTADEALDAMTRALGEHGQGGSGQHRKDDPYFSSFMIADARGGWMLETSARTWAARPIGNGSSISNRISLSTDWTIASPDVEPGADFDRWRSPKISTSIADHRLAATRACVARRPLPGDDTIVADVVATLRDHGNGPWGSPSEPADPTSADRSALPPATADDGSNVTVCMHVGDYQVTTAACVFDLRIDAPARAWACLGSPCVSVFVPFFPPTLPATLNDPAQWHRFARLRDRVESAPDQLDAVRSVLAPAERALWEDADDIAASGSRERVASYTSRATGVVDAALTTLGV